MEFLLANHPLDCPVCDQGGECDLQDQSMAYGSDRSRTLNFNKRAVADKDFGPLIKTSMNRCIHCTRCVRFANDVAGLQSLGSTGRGNRMEIGTYIDEPLNSVMSGNVVDLCPVGALTSKPYAFKARPWELRRTESIDVMDAVGSNIRVDSRGLEVMRILPRLNESVNEEWIADKTRYAYDGLTKQRLTQPMMKIDGKLVPVDWETALSKASEKIQEAGKNFQGLIGAFSDAESMTALRDLAFSVGSNQLHFDGPAFQSRSIQRSDYLFNTTIGGIEDCDLCLLVGCNPEHEAPILNTRIRKTWLYGPLKILSVGPKIESNYEIEHLGTSSSALFSSDLVALFKKAQNPMIICGETVTHNPNYLSIESQLKSLAPKGFNILHTQASRVGALDLGYNSVERREAKVVYLLNADDDLDIPKSAFVIYQGHHGDAGAMRADIVLPGSAYTEKNATFVNLEGRVQQTTQSVPPPGNAKEDWKIIRAVSEYMKPLPYDSVEELRQRMEYLAPSFSRLDEIDERCAFDRIYKPTKTSFEVTAKVFDYYLSDVISKNSVTMSKCSKAFNKA